MMNVGAPSAEAIDQLNERMIRCAMYIHRRIYILKVLPELLIKLNVVMCAKCVQFPSEGESNKNWCRQCFWQHAHDDDESDDEYEDESEDEFIDHCDDSYCVEHRIFWRDSRYCNEYCEGECGASLICPECGTKEGA